MYIYIHFLSTFVVKWPLSQYSIPLVPIYIIRLSLSNWGLLPMYITRHPSPWQRQQTRQHPFSKQRWERRASKFVHGDRWAIKKGIDRRFVGCADDGKTANVCMTNAEVSTDRTCGRGERLTSTTDCVNVTSARGQLQTSHFSMILMNYIRNLLAKITLYRRPAIVFHQLL